MAEECPSLRGCVDITKKIIEELKNYNDAMDVATNMLEHLKVMPPENVRAMRDAMEQEDKMVITLLATLEEMEENGLDCPMMQRR